MSYTYKIFCEIDAIIHVFIGYNYIKISFIGTFLSKYTNIAWKLEECFIGSNKSLFFVLFLRPFWLSFENVSVHIVFPVFRVNFISFLAQV